MLEWKSSSFFLLALIIILDPFEMTPKAGRILKTSALRIGYQSSAGNWAAINIAVTTAQKNGLLPNENISYVYQSSYCDQKSSLSATINLTLLNSVDVVIGPQCSTSCETAGYIASYWNIPILPEACSDIAIDNKTAYNTLIRVIGSWNGIGVAFIRVFQFYEWKEIVLITDVVAGNCMYGATAIFNNAKGSFNVMINDWIQVTSSPTSDEINTVITRLSEQGRIIVMCHTTTSVVGQILFAAQDAGMTNGDYAFFTFSGLPSASTPFVWNQYNMTGQNITYRMMAFYALKLMTFPNTTNNETASLTAEVAALNIQPPWKIALSVDMPNPATVAYTYDAAYLYMILANEVISEGLDVRNGTLIFSKAIGVSFQGMTGMVTIGSNGDREQNPLLWAYGPNMTAYSVYMSINIVDDVITMVRDNIVWGLMSSPPRDVPVCGFINQLCPPQQYSISTAAVVGGSVAGTATLLAAFGLLWFIRVKKNEERIRQMTWKISYEDLQFNNAFAKRTKVSSSSVLRSEVSLGNFSHKTSLLDRRQMILDFDSVAVYRGIIVKVFHVKEIYSHLTRSDLIDLVNLKELTHDNVQTFVGASIDPGRSCFVVLYCNRGTVQDILADDDIKLDWVFRISLISDLVNGMAYLHKSPFHSHGNLSSATCLVDNRWTLKISCIIPSVFVRSKCGRAAQEGEEHDGGTMYRDLLWTAPELLRLKVKPIHGTPKGDVFSFAIVVQEIAYRAAPFFTEDCNPQDMVELLKAGGAKLFRPVPNCPLKEMPQLVSLMTQCWAEAPHDRPTFEEISRQLRRFNNGWKVNIVDLVLQKLEKYANNLETIVEQRTSELLQEKQKTDLLLYRMLPPYVAEQLKTGKTVLPEMYPSVTVYFSDIVGFTTLSSNSTPMQVVDLLNDLYGMFDDTISKHDVYKVETIGDAYMVVSGVPKPNEGRHIVEISNMALDLLKEVSAFKIRHKPEETLRLRIGIHTGPCAAGVVGHTMPHYCLFGDTVNVASRMESTGEACRIQLSEVAREALRRFIGYKTELRGEVFVKGKGMMLTYWLLDKRHLDCECSA